MYLFAVRLSRLVLIAFMLPSLLRGHNAIAVALVGSSLIAFIALYLAHGVNIATMSLSRNQAGGTALTVLNLDTIPDEALLEKIRGSEDIKSAQVIEL